MEHLGGIIPQLHRITTLQLLILPHLLLLRIVTPLPVVPIIILLQAAIKIILLLLVIMEQVHQLRLLHIGLLTTQAAPERCQEQQVLTTILPLPLLERKLECHQEVLPQLHTPPEAVVLKHMHTCDQNALSSLKTIEASTPL